MSAILLDQQIVHYEVLGRGRPIIFLHGWVGSWRYWIPVMQAASYFLPGLCPQPVGVWRYSQVAGSLSPVWPAAPVGCIPRTDGNYAVCSGGARIGSYSGPVVCSAKPGSGGPHPGHRLSDGCRLDLILVCQNDSPADLAEWLLSRLPEAEPARTDAPKTDPKVVQASLASLPGTSLSELWRNTSTSCLLVHGQNDPVIHLPKGDEFDNLPEHMHSIVFDQSGHFPMLDETNKFNRLLVDFLTLPSGDSPRELQLKDEWKRRVR